MAYTVNGDLFHHSFQVGQSPTSISSFAAFAGGDNNNEKVVETLAADKCNQPTHTEIRRPFARTCLKTPTPDTDNPKKVFGMQKKTVAFGSTTKINDTILKERENILPIRNNPATRSRINILPTLDLEALKRQFAEHKSEYQDLTKKVEIIAEKQTDQSELYRIVMDISSRLMALEQCNATNLEKLRINESKGGEDLNSYSKNNRRRNLKDDDMLLSSKINSIFSNSFQQTQDEASSGKKQQQLISCNSIEQGERKFQQHVDQIEKLVFVYPHLKFKLEKMLNGGEKIGLCGSTDQNAICRDEQDERHPLNNRGGGSIIHRLTVQKETVFSSPASRPQYQRNRPKVVDHNNNNRTLPVNVVESNLNETKQRRQVKNCREYNRRSPTEEPANSHLPRARDIDTGDEAEDDNYSLSQPVDPQTVVSTSKVQVFTFAEFARNKKADESRGTEESPDWKKIT